MAIERNVFGKFKENAISPEKMHAIITEKEALNVCIATETDETIKHDLIQKRDALLTTVAKAYLPILVAKAHEVGKRYGLSQNDIQELISGTFPTFVNAVNAFKLKGMSFANYAKMYINSTMHKQAYELRGHHISLQNPIGSDPDNDDLLSVLPDTHSPNAERQFGDQETNVELGNAISETLDELDPQEKRVIQMRYLQTPAMGLKEIGEAMDLSRQRIHQIELAARRKMRGYFQKYDIDATELFTE